MITFECNGKDTMYMLTIREHGHQCAFCENRFYPMDIAIMRANDYFCSGQCMRNYDLTREWGRGADES